MKAATSAPDSQAAPRVIANLRELARLTSTDAGAQRPAWSPLWRRASAWFDSKVADLGLIVEADAAGNNWVTLPGKSDTLPSGPLHDASEMAPLVPTVMLFSSSTRGLSHCKEEDTPEEHLLQTIQAFQLLADRTIQHLAVQGS